MEPLFPELVTPPTKEDERETPYVMNYAGFGVLAVKAVQEQQTLIEAQATEIKAQHSEIEAQKAIIATLSSQLKKITAALQHMGAELR